MCVSQQQQEPALDRSFEQQRAATTYATLCQRLNDSKDPIETLSEFIAAGILTPSVRKTQTQQHTSFNPFDDDEM